MLARAATPNLKRIDQFGVCNNTHLRACTLVPAAGAMRYGNCSAGTNRFNPAGLVVERKRSLQKRASEALVIWASLSEQRN